MAWACGGEGNDAPPRVARACKSESIQRQAHGTRACATRISRAQESGARCGAAHGAAGARWLPAAVGWLVWGWLVCSLPASEPSAVIAVDREPFAGRLVSIDSSGMLRFAAVEGEALLPMEALVRWGSLAESKQGPLVYLRDGSVLVADSIESQGADLLLGHALLGEVRVRREEVLGVLVRPPNELERRDALENRILRLSSEAAEPTELAADLVLLANGDELAGQLGLLSARGLTIDGELGAAELTWDRVTAVLFGLARPETFAAGERGEAMRTIAGLRDGSRLLARGLEVEGTTLRLVPWWSEEQAAYSLAAEHLVFLQPLGGRARYLSDLKPESYRHIPYLSLGWNYRLDRCVTGRLLRARGKLYLKGVGMHSASRLTWRLDRPYRRFEAAVAIDDAAGPRGSVVFRVFVDSEERYRSPVVRGGAAPLPISVDLTGGSRLSLIVDFADRGDELDLADWLDARLVGED